MRSEHVISAQANMRVAKANAAATQPSNSSSAAYPVAK